MNRFVLIVAVMAVVFLVAISCSDDTVKVGLDSQPVRVEYSKCVGCYECLDDFSCPYDAIKKDPRTLTVIIDQDKCVQCMRCVDQFECPEEAFMTEADEIAPAAIDTLEVVSDSIGVVQIRFIATGDDGSQGLAFRYTLTLRDSLNHPVPFSFDLPVPSPAGFEENWRICDLPQNAALRVELEAFDEVSHTSGVSAQNVVVAGEIVDTEAPAVIGDLDAVSSETAITLSWTAVGDDGTIGLATGYDIRYSTELLTESSWAEANQYSQSLNPAISGTAEELIITDLPVQEQYYFGIRAYDEVHNYAAISNVVQAQIAGDIVTPDAIDDLTVASLSMNSMLISWTAVGDDGSVGSAAAYEIKVHTQPITTTNWEVIAAYPQQMQPLPAGETESLLIQGLEPVTNYYAAIKAIDDAANISLLSNVVQGETTQMPDTTPPATITDLAAISTQDDITLSWTAPGDDGDQGTAVSYEIRASQNEITPANWDAADLLPNPPAPQVAGTQQSYICTYAQPGIQYYFAIRAADDSQNVADVSNNASASLLNDTIAPATISDLDAVAGASDIILSWTAVGDDGTVGLADHYQMRFATAPITEANWESADILPNPPTPADPGSVETYIASGFTMGVEFYFGIKAFDEADNASALSNVASAVITQDITPPSTINDLAVTAGLALNASTIRISWTAPGDDGTTGTAAVYDIRYGSAPITVANWDAATTFADPPLPQMAGTVQTCDVSGLPSAEIIYFAIRTADDNGNTSDISNSPAGKIVYQINRPPCNGCGHCVSHCPEGAITDHGSYASINADLCEACGDCVIWCPRDAIKLHVVEY